MAHWLQTLRTKRDCNGKLTISYKIEPLTSLYQKQLSKMGPVETEKKESLSLNA